MSCQQLSTNSSHCLVQFYSHFLKDSVGNLNGIISACVTFILQTNCKEIGVIVGFNKPYKPAGYIVAADFSCSCFSLELIAIVVRKEYGVFYCINISFVKTKLVIIQLF